MSMATLKKQFSKLKRGFDRDACWSLFFKFLLERVHGQRSKERLGDIKGIFLPRGTRQYILVQYVKDIALSIKEDEENICNVVDLLQLFILIKGLGKLVAY